MGVGEYIEEDSGTMRHITDKGDNCPSDLGTGRGVYPPNQPVSPAHLPKLSCAGTRLVT
jgi:hypothetical protein